MDEDIYTDDPSRYCNICWNKEELRKELDDLVSEFETNKGKLYAKWKKQSLSQ